MAFFGVRENVAWFGFVDFFIDAKNFRHFFNSKNCVFFVGVKIVDF